MTQLEDEPKQTPQARWRQNNPEKSRAATRASYFRHHEKRKANSRANAKASYPVNKLKLLERNRRWRINNPEKARAIGRRWREGNREKCRASNVKASLKRRPLKKLKDAIYKRENRERLSLRVRELDKKRMADPVRAERRRAQRRRHYRENCELITEKRAIWRKKNREQIKQRAMESGRMQASRAWRKKWRQQNRLRCALESRIRRALKTFKKSASTAELIGCSLDDLREHLQLRFVAPMQWNNHGPVWHIDHIIPCVAFDLSSEDEQRKCFHYSNLQPLLAVDNLRKNSRHPETGILIRRKTIPPLSTIIR